jgi:hypothetical protein
MSNNTQLYTEISYTSFGKPLLFLTYKPAFNGLHAEWVGFADLEDIKRAAMLIIDAFKQTNADKYINDTRKVAGVYSFAAEWTAKEWLPMVVEAGLVYIATVFSGNTFAKLSAQETEKAIDKKGVVIYKNFDTLEEAELWLQEKNSLVA